MAVTDKQKENLRPILPGETRNPNGRPLGVKNRATELKKLLAIKQKVKNPLKGGKEETMTVEEMIDLALIIKALSGDVRAIQLIKDTLYGKIPVDVNLCQENGNPVIVDKKITDLSIDGLLIIKYGINSIEVKEYQERYK